MTRYFAYGANMDPVHMAERCPQAIRLGPARLQGRAFKIAAKGYGDAQPAAGSELLGVLWELSPSDEAALDAFEGVPEGAYYKEAAVVLAHGGRQVAEQLDFPAGYLERLRGTLQAG